VRTLRTQGKALALTLLGLGVSLAQAATPPNTIITNTATATYQVGGSPVTANSSVQTTTSARTPATIEFLQYVPSGSAGTVEQVNTASCGGSPLPNPTYLFGSVTNLTVPGTLRLAPATHYSGGDSLFIRVTDYDQNQNASAIETIVVTVTSPTGDSEIITLSETGVSTGVFIGYLPSTNAAATANNCTLSVSGSQTITASYTDPADAVPTVTDTALVDPFGTLFNSSNGSAINGAQMSLIDDLSGLPTTVYCNDGVTVLAQPVTSGSPTNCDATMASGGYHFPRVAPGSYRLAVTPPATYAFPSSVAPASLPGGYTVVGIPGNGASYGTAFVISAGPAQKIDVPLDPSSGSLQIIKTAGKSVIGIGEFLSYTLSIRNNSPSTATAVQISDRLPQGFRYQKGSARLNGNALPNPTISKDGRSLVFTIGDIAANTTVTLRYVVMATSGTPIGDATNSAVAVAPNSSNTAKVTVTVQDDLFSQKALLIGRVIVGSCDDRVENDDKGLAGARVLLENGTYVITDREGRWHMDNISPGTHVVQLDLDSLPEDYEVVACEENTRFAGRSFSQFVNVRGGTLWRADFHVRKRPAESICVNQTMRPADGAVELEITYPVSSLSTSVTLMVPEGTTVADMKLNGAALKVEQTGNVVVTRLPARARNMRDVLRFGVNPNTGEIRALVRVQPQGLPGQSLPAMTFNLATQEPVSQCAAVAMAMTTPEAPRKAPAQKQLQLVEQLPYDEKWLAAAPPGLEWLHPRADFLPAIPSAKIAVKHEPTQRIEMRVNGQIVSPLNYDGSLRNAAGTVALSTWRGVELSERNNTMEMRVFDATGQLVKSETRTIHYADKPARVELVESQSRLIADGKTPPVIAVRIRDTEGYPVRRGLNGEFQLNEPYQSAERAEGFERDPLSGRIGGSARFEVTADGIALIELLPTTQTGEVVLGFRFRDIAPQEVRTWLNPAEREWVLVGFAEGTSGHKTLSGNTENLRDANVDDKLYDDNKVALYAKGSIKGEYLMTVAYDTAKQTGASTSNLKQAINPNQYYTLYADATQPQFDAASASKLYVKIEKARFYAMFGDYDTGLTITEFSRYTRTLNGVKSEYQGDRVAYNAFAAQTTQGYHRDEIPGNGTSGLYRLSVGNIIVNSDKVRIETRDRFHSEMVTSVRVLTRYLDYDINYQSGTLSFREPVPVTDGLLNFVYIIAEYESNDSSDQRMTYGGRAAVKPTDQLEVGMTHIHEGNVGAPGNLTGADATYKLDDKTRVKAEVAGSSRTTSGQKQDGDAWKLEVVREDKDLTGRVYARQQDENFGLGQQSGQESGTRKVGADARYKLTDNVAVQGEVFQQNVLTTGAQRDVAEGRVEWRDQTILTYAGARSARDQFETTSDKKSEQAIAGASWLMPDQRTTLRAGVEVDVSGNGGQSSDYPNRYTLGADYKLTAQSTLFAEQEFARGEDLSADTTRVGVRTKPWTGGELAASVGSQTFNDAERLYGNMGLVQRWQINENWQTDFSIGRSKTLQSKGAVQLNSNVPLSSGSLNGSNDYTSASVGVQYKESDWSANTRLEWREAETEDQLNWFAGVQRKLDAGRSVAGGLSVYDSDTKDGVHTSKSDVRLSYAYRPNDSQWVWFDRLNFITDRYSDSSSSENAHKLVNNFHANWIPNRKVQYSFQYGAKYVFDRIDDKDYDGYTDLLGFEARRSLGKKWDIGAQASGMHSWNADTLQYSMGVSVGYLAFENAWLALGYNVIGFNDNEFGAAGYRAEGFYIALRFKFDQDTFGLNRPGSIVTMNR